MIKIPTSYLHSVFAGVGGGTGSPSLPPRRAQVAANDQLKTTCNLLDASNLQKVTGGLGGGEQKPGLPPRRGSSANGKESYRW